SATAPSSSSSLEKSNDARRGFMELLEVLEVLELLEVLEVFSKVADGSSKVLGDLASRVKNIEGKPMQPGGSKPTMSADVNKENSYASLVRPNVATKVHFRTLVNEEKVDNFDCDPSFPVVQQYVSNTWRKFGFEKITKND
ncbi:hypothetical protein Tco_0715217, partial [Tanacetum coccineum]